MLQLFKDGDHMAIKTNEPDEHEFTRAFSAALDELIVAGVFDGPGELTVEDNGGSTHSVTLASDWSFQFQYWLPIYVDICCKYRGYKNNVQEQKVLFSGSILPGDDPLVYVNDREEIQLFWGVDRPNTAST